MDGTSARNFGVGDVIDFIRGNDRRGTCFGRWPNNILSPFISFSADIGSLHLVQKDGELVAVGFARQIDEDDLDRHWLPQKREGTAIEFQDVLSKNKQGLETLIDEFTSRHPDWREKKLFATRHGQRKRIQPELIERLMA